MSCNGNVNNNNNYRNNPTAVEVPPLALQTSQFIELWEQPTDLINKTRSPPFNDYVTNMITINPQVSDSVFSVEDLYGVL